MSCFSGAMPWLAVISAMRSAPRSGQITPEPTSRKCGATISRSICSSVSLVSAKTIQDGCAPGSRAWTSMRRTMPSGPGAVDDLDAVALIGIILDPAREIDRLGVRRHAHRFSQRPRGGRRPERRAKAGGAGRRNATGSGDLFGRRLIGCRLIGGMVLRAATPALDLCRKFVGSQFR